MNYPQSIYLFIRLVMYSSYCEQNSSALTPPPSPSAVPIMQFTFNSITIVLYTQLMKLKV